MAMFGILGLPAAAQPPLDYTALLQTAAASPNEAFLSFIRNHGARRTDRPAVLEQMQRLRIVVPDTLPRGQRFESIWTIDLPDQRGLAVHFAGNPANGASAVFMLFHRPAEGTPMGVHRVGTCAFSCSTGRADGCEEWQLIHLTKPWVCRCLFAPAGMEQSDLEQILHATVPSSEN